MVNSYSAGNNIPYFYAKHRLISMFTKACRWILSWAIWIHYTPSFLFKVYLYPPLLHLVLSIYFFLLRFFLKNVGHISSFPCVCYMPCPSYPFSFSVLRFHSRNMNKGVLIKINIYHSNRYYSRSFKDAVTTARCCGIK